MEFARGSPHFGNDCLDYCDDNRKGKEFPNGFGEKPLNRQDRGKKRKGRRDNLEARFFASLMVFLCDLYG